MRCLGSIPFDRLDRFWAVVLTRRSVDCGLHTVRQFELRERRYEALRVIQRAEVVCSCLARDRLRWTPSPTK